MGWKVTSGPSIEPLTRAEAKAHLRVTHTSEDTLIDAMIAAAREEVEAYCNIALITQTIEETFECFPMYSPQNLHSSLRLSVSPLIEITSISYIDTDGNSQVLATTVYDKNIHDKPGKVTLKYDQVWPTTAHIENAVTVTYTAGYGANASDVPNLAKHAMRLIIGNWYEKRQDDPQTPFKLQPAQAAWLRDFLKVY